MFIAITWLLEVLVHDDKFTCLYGGLILSLFYLGNNEQALEYFKRALPIAREIKDRTGEATILNNIGIVNSNRGEHQRAPRQYKLALPLSRAVGDRLGEAVSS